MVYWIPKGFTWKAQHEFFSPNHVIFGPCGYQSFTIPPEWLNLHLILPFDCREMDFLQAWGSTNNEEGKTGYSVSLILSSNGLHVQYAFNDMISCPGIEEWLLLVTFFPVPRILILFSSGAHDSEEIWDRLPASKLSIDNNIYSCCRAGILSLRRKFSEWTCYLQGKNAISSFQTLCSSQRIIVGAHRAYAVTIQVDCESGVIAFNSEARC